MIAVGMDLLEIDRLEAALARRPRLAERLFTASELAYAEAKARPATHLAARFCAKEAVAKALDMRNWSFRDVEVVSTGGAPLVKLSGRVAESATQKGVALSVSLTHSKQTAAAVALAVDAAQGSR